MCVAEVQLRVIPDDPVQAGLFGLVQIAGRTRDIGARRLLPSQHAASVAHLLVVETGGEPVLESIAPEIAPEISAASEIFSVPVDLRMIP
jgi:hypothetical protein